MGSAKSAASKRGRKRHRRHSRRPPIELSVSYRRDEYAARDAKRTQKALGKLRAKFRHEGLVLFVGAGVSASLRLPTWNELLSELTTSSMFFIVPAWDEARGGLSEYYNTRDRDLVHAVRQREGTSKSPIISARLISFFNKSDLADVVMHSLYVADHEVFSYVMDNYWERYRRVSKADSLKGLPTSTLIDSLIDLCGAGETSGGIKAIVNYNFDNLLDEHLRTAGLNFNAVSSSRDRLRRSARPCYHVHGILPFRDFCNQQKPSRRIVFSEDEYHAEYANPFSWSNLIQTSLLCSATGLFVGHSLTDPNIRRLVDLCHRQNSHMTHYAILRRSRPLAKSGRAKRDSFVNYFEEAERALYSQIGIEVIWVDEFDEIPDILTSIAKAN